MILHLLLIVTLALALGTRILYVTNFLIMLYLSMKFDDFHLNGFKEISETCFDLSSLKVTLTSGVAI